MKIVLTPDWFLGSDVLIEGFSFIVLLLFFFLSYKNYKITKNKKTLYLGIGFLLIAIAEAATILTKFILYYDTTFTRELGQMILTYKVVKSVDIIYYAGFFFNKLLALLGLYIIYKNPVNRESVSTVILAIYFIIIASFLGTTTTYLFHLTAIILLVLIITNYGEIYRKNKSRNTGILIIAFSILLASHLIMVLFMSPVCYVFAQVIQLVSYIILLLLIISILKYGKERKKAK